MCDSFAHVSEDKSNFPKLTYIQAFRMIHDVSFIIVLGPHTDVYVWSQLGIHLAPDKVVGASHLSDEELATRDRLFWTAFIWDK
jgi:hypothetical protein